MIKLDGSRTFQFSKDLSIPDFQVLFPQLLRLKGPELRKDFPHALLTDEWPEQPRQPLEDVLDMSFLQRVYAGSEKKLTVNTQLSSAGATVHVQANQESATSSDVWLCIPYTDPPGWTLCAPSSMRPQLPNQYRVSTQ